MILNKAELSQKVDVSKRTITRWDNVLLDKNIIIKDGFYYFCIDNTSQEIRQCSKEEYNSFWKNKAYIKAFNDLKIKHDKGLITTNELMISAAGVGAYISSTQKVYYYRINKYITKRENGLYIDTLNLIESIYLDKDINIIGLLSQ